MAQLTIDIGQDSKETLQAACYFLQEILGTRKVEHASAQDLGGHTHTGDGNLDGLAEWAGNAAAAPKEGIELEDGAPTGDINEHVQKLADANLKLDLHGVPYNKDMCSAAKDPFYASGARKGQWKKKKPVSEEDYDAWYVASKPAPANTAGQDEPTQVDSSTAFGNAPASALFDVPTDCGGLMTWISVKQAAELLLQSDIDAAWSLAGLSGVGDIVPPNPPEAIAKNVATLYAILSAKAGA